MHTFSCAVNLQDLLAQYHCNSDCLVNMQIGFDRRLYLLLNAAIPERIDGMFVPTVSNSRFATLVLVCEWETGVITGTQFLDFGVQKTNYDFIQPVHDGFLLVGAKCMCDKNGIGERNAAVLDQSGQIIRHYCFGDGIQDVIVRSDGRIITSYFDEGIFGNYGWTQPIGASGLLVWNTNGEIIWKAERDICDCYAMNLDDRERLWYYYYTEFALVRTDLQTETVFHPGISGAQNLFFTADEQSILIDSGYQKYGAFVRERIRGSSLSSPEPFALNYKDKAVSVVLCTSRGSRAAFLDNQNRLFMTQFVNA